MEIPGLALREHDGGDDAARGGIAGAL